MTNPIQFLISEIESLGWYVYRLDSEPAPYPIRWSCSLRYPDGDASLIAFGQGDTIFDALSAAFNAIDRAQPEPKSSTPWSTDLTKPAQIPQSIIERLFKPAQASKPIRRI